MMENTPPLALQLLAHLTDRSSQFLHEILRCPIEDEPQESPLPNQLPLYDLTSVVTLGGSFNCTLAFSFEMGLLRQILAWYAAGLTLTAAEEPLYLEETAGDLLNNMVGNSTADVPLPAGERTLLSPPIILNGAATLTGSRNTACQQRELVTPFGRLRIYCVGRER